jgi:stringent starvation protein B
MSELISTKPYMIRAIYEWCNDNQLTPHVLVSVNNETIVPASYVKNGEIVLNLNYSATKDLQIGQDAITFTARFSGESRNLYIPVSAVKGIFARENGQGMFFEINQIESDNNNDLMPVSVEDKKNKLKKMNKPSLKLVK